MPLGPKDALNEEGKLEMEPQVTGNSAPERTVTIQTMPERDSFLFPEGNAPDQLPPASRQGGVLLELLLFTLFVASRAFHPAFIDNAKVLVPGADKPALQYAKIMPVVLECVVTMILGQMIAYGIGGIEEWKKIWRLAPLKVFGAIGIVYAWGDILEVLATSSVSGDAYQVLLQSKLLVTAVMMRMVKGTRTSNLQWTILAVVMCAMSVYSIAGKPPSKPKPCDPKFYNMTVAEYVAMEAAKPQEAEAGVDMEFVLGIGLVVLKVVVSCFCAVLSDKYMKDWQSLPIYIQLVQFKVTWLPMVVVYSFFDGETWVKGPMHGFDFKATLVLGSFTVKFWLTMYLLAILDSVLKNIGEASSVLVTFFLSIYVFNKSQFALATFLMVLSVTLSVIAYIQSKPVVDKAKKYDEALSQ